MPVHHALGNTVIRKFNSPEEEINEFMSLCKSWLLKGKPAGDKNFRETRALCESLDYFLSDSDVYPVFLVGGYTGRREEIRQILAEFKDCLYRARGDSSYPFNRQSLTHHCRDSYLKESLDGTFWENEDRVAFVMNFSTLNKGGCHE